MAGSRKNGVSINAYIGEELFTMLEEHCSMSGQSKTVAVERAIREYCGKPESDSENRPEQ